MAREQASRGASGEGFVVSRGKRALTAERINQAREVALARLRGEVASMPSMGVKRGRVSPFVTGPSERSLALRTKAGQST